MLTRTVLSAKDLCITEDEHSALLKVRKMLAAGELAHHTHDIQLYGGRTPNLKLFNMNHYYYVHEGHPVCGTPRCIGGWVGYFTNTPNVSWALRLLFHPLLSNPHMTKPYGAITPREAVEAIDKFLSGCSSREIWSHT